VNSLLALFSITLLTAPSVPTIEVVAPAEVIHVGDPVTVELAIDLPDGEHPIFPQWEDAWGDAEILEVGEINTTPNGDGTSRLSQQLTVTFFQTGEMILAAPPFDLSSNSGSDEEASEPSPSIALTVESLLPPGEEVPEPQPPTPPRSLEWGTGFIWTTALFGLLSLTALGLLLRRRAAAASGYRPPADPLTILGEALEGLRSGAVIEEMFEGMSLHLRRFFGQTLAFRAAESTTSEIRLQLRQKQLPHTLIKRTETLLLLCDGVKFARRELSREEAEQGISEAAAIGAETINAIAPPPAEDAEELS
jgi:hypothetical protein